MRIITKSSIVQCNLTANFGVQIARVPKGYDFRSTFWECDDRSIQVANTSGSVWMKVFEPHNKSPIAWATFAADHQVVRCDTIEVEYQHRRKGIATALYVIASCIFEAPVIPSDDLSQDSRLFWAGIAAKSDGQHEIVCRT